MSLLPVRIPLRRLTVGFRGGIAALLLAYIVLIGGTTRGVVELDHRSHSRLILLVVLCLWVGTALLRRRKIAAVEIDRYVAIAFAALIVTSALSTDPRRSVGFLGLVTLYGLWFYMVADLEGQGWSVDVLEPALLLVGAVVIAEGLREAVGVYAGALGQPGLPQAIRVSSVLDHPNILSAFLNLLLPLAIVRLLGAPRYLKPPLVLWIATNLVLQFFTSSRGGWLATAVSLVLLCPLVLAASRRAGSRADGLWRTWRWRIVVAAIPLASIVGYLGWRQLSHQSHAPVWFARWGFWRSAWLTFESYPIFGSGPFTFGTEFLKYNGVPPSAIFNQAHSVPLTILAEGGLLLFLSSAVLYLVVVRLVWRRWQKADRSARLCMSAAIASLLGFSVHGLFDNPLLEPAVAMTAIAILASVCAVPVKPAGARGPTALPVRPLSFLLVGGLLIWGSVWSDRAYDSLGRAVYWAGTNRWQEAARLLDAAASADDHLAFYQLQRGYAWGVVAAHRADGDALARAIGAYEEGIRLEPNYSVNHANLAALYRQAGRGADALREMGLARHLAPTASVFRLNLAQYAEQTGNASLAVENYVAFLRLRPEIHEAEYFWARTAARRTALEKWRATFGLNPAIGPWTALARGDLSTARAGFASAVSEPDTRSDAFEGLARVSLAEGDFGAAERYLATGLSVTPEERIASRARLLVALGDVAFEQGACPAATSRYAAALEMTTHSSVFGITRGRTLYGNLLFRRMGFNQDLLPQVNRLDLADPWLETLKRTFTCYDDTGISNQQRAEPDVPIARLTGVFPDSGFDLETRFESGILLLYKEVPEQEVPAGSQVELRLAWLLPRPQTRDYTVFVHLRDKQGTTVAQCDMRLVGDSASVVSYQKCPLSVPADLPPGEYHVNAGLYELESLERATILVNGERQQEIDLGLLKLGRAQI